MTNYQEFAEFKAIQWIVTNGGDVFCFLDESQARWETVEFCLGECIITRPPGMTLIAVKGDWILRDLVGELHVLNAKDFEQNIGKGMYKWPD